MKGTFTKVCAGFMDTIMSFKIYTLESDLGNKVIAIDVIS